MIRTEVCIVGAGPAGATLSHFLSKKKIEHVLLDKTSFPRDKVCGDGITVDVLNTLKRIDPALLDEFAHYSNVQPAWGFCFHAANGREMRYSFKEDQFKYAPFFTTKRWHLDDFLVKRLNPGFCNFLPQSKVVEINRHTDGVEIIYQNEEGKSRVNAKIVIGAEGEKPVVTKQLGLEHYREKSHLIGALRVYYKNVKGFKNENHLEFFFDKRLLPGYFWAFPLNNNEANVGVGMVSTAISKKKFNLKKVFEEMLQTHPKIREMFAEAEPLEKPQGWGLPLITPERKIAGERYALIGDAGGMIEPFTGKGIGPGMVSARICADHIEDALTSGNYDMMEYNDHMYRYYRGEIKAGYTLQKLLKYPVVLNGTFALANFAPLKRWSHQKMVKEWHRWM